MLNDIFFGSSKLDLPKDVTCPSTPPLNVETCHSQLQISVSIQPLEKKRKLDTLAQFVCTATEKCRKSFSRRDNLKQHIKQCHPEACDHKVNHYKCDVAGCTESFYHATKLVPHLQGMHHVSVGKCALPELIIINNNN